VIGSMTRQSPSFIPSLRHRDLVSRIPFVHAGTRQIPPACSGTLRTGLLSCVLLCSASINGSDGFTNGRASELFLRMSGKSRNRPGWSGKYFILDRPFSAVFTPKPEKSTTARPHPSTKIISATPTSDPQNRNVQPPPQHPDTHRPLGLAQLGPHRQAAVTTFFARVRIVFGVQGVKYLGLPERAGYEGAGGSAERGR
jgi:hypothetical protein